MKNIVVENGTYQIRQLLPNLVIHWDIIFTPKHVMHTMFEQNVAHSSVMHTMVEQNVSHSYYRRQMHLRTHYLKFRFKSFVF